MGLFDKKYCDICGDKIGFLGNRKLADGNMCKTCARKLSPLFSERRKSTAEEIRAALKPAQREQTGVIPPHVLNDQHVIGMEPPSEPVSSAPKAENGCKMCGAVFSDPDARFCANCGAKREV